MTQARWVNVRRYKTATGHLCANCGKGSRSFVQADRIQGRKRMRVWLCQDHAEQAGIDHADS